MNYVKPNRERLLCIWLPWQWLLWWPLPCIYAKFLPIQWVGTNHSWFRKCFLNYVDLLWIMKLDVVISNIVLFYCIFCQTGQLRSSCKHKIPFTSQLPVFRFIALVSRVTLYNLEFARINHMLDVDDLQLLAIIKNQLERIFFNDILMFLD